MYRMLILFITAACASILTRLASLNSVYPDQALTEPTRRTSFVNLAKSRDFKAYRSIYISSQVRYLNARSTSSDSDARWNKTIKKEKEYDQPPHAPYIKADEDQHLEEYVGGAAGTSERLQPLLTWFFIRIREFFRIREFIQLKRNDRSVFDIEAEEHRKELMAIDLLVRLSPFSRKLA